MKIYKTWKSSGDSFESDINDLMEHAILVRMPTYATEDLTDVTYNQESGQFSKKEVLKMLDSGLSFQSLGAFWSQDKYKKDRVRLFCD